MSSYRVFGGVADGRWFPGGQSMVAVSDETPPSPYAPTAWLGVYGSRPDRYHLQTWVYHDAQRCTCDWRRVAVHYGCLWRGRAWVREDDQATMEQITASLNTILGLCQMGRA